MTNNDDSTKAQSELEIVITRIFNAPRTLVFQTWIEPKHIEQWWGPKGFKTKVVEMDVKAGGVWRYVMQGSDGTEYPVKGIFREIVPPEKIVTSDEFEEEYEYQQMTPSDSSKGYNLEKMSPDDLPSGMITIITFEEIDGKKTQLTIKTRHQSAEERQKHEDMGVIAGWNSSFECLDVYLAQF